MRATIGESCGFALVCLRTSLKRITLVGHPPQRVSRRFFFPTSNSTDLVTTLSHIFLCQGPLSLDAAGRIASALGAEPGHEFHFLVSFQGSIKGAPTGSHFSFMRPAAESFSELERPFRIAQWFHEWLKDWKEIVPRSIVYLSHPFELPGNFFLFGDPKPKEVHLLPDGLINYYDHPLRAESSAGKLRYQARMILRQAAAKIHGLTYVPLYDGHLTQFERGLYLVTWTDWEKGLLTVSGQIRLLPKRAHPPREHQRSTPKRVLFLDQELHQLVKPNLEKRMRDALIAHAHTNAAKELYYKAHPRGANRSEALRHSGLKVRDVSNDRLAEEFIVQEQIDGILGFYSTPLILSANDVSERHAFLPSPSEKGVRRPARLELLDDVPDCALSSI